MCGIIGVVNKEKPAFDGIMHSLKELEYRGYDSAGIIFANDFDTYKSLGSLINLEAMSQHSKDTTGLGHTRWATHGKVCIENAHPIKIKNYAIVHNGVIYNTDELLKITKHKPNSETDTEILLATFINFIKNASEEEALKKTLELAQGSFAAAILKHGSKRILWLKKGISPLCINKTKDGFSIASDSHAFLHPGEIQEIVSNACGEITEDSSTIWQGECKPKTIEKESSEISKNEQTWFEHEINDQLRIFQEQEGKKIDIDLTKFKNIKLVGCGSSFFAASIGKIWLEENGIIANAEIASEFNMQKNPADKNIATILISQSGYTADTLLALSEAQEKGHHTISLVNNTDSPLATNANQTIHLEAGKEKSVASSKSFSAQVIKLHQIIKGELPKKMSQLIKSTLSIDIAKHSQSLSQAHQIIIIGKNTLHIAAQEGALKIKEITYKNTQAYAAGELKHGYISTIDENTYIIALVANETEIAKKTIASAIEAKARGAKIILISHLDNPNADMLIKTEEMNLVEATFAYSIILQKIALKIGEILGVNIDKPRNLAKSVTVE